MVTDRVRHYREKQEADRSVGQSQEVEVTVFHVDLHAGVACRKGDQHQEPVGEMRSGKEQRREQRHVPRIRREGPAIGSQNGSSARTAATGPTDNTPLMTSVLARS